MIWVLNSNRRHDGFSGALRGGRARNSRTFRNPKGGVGSPRRHLSTIIFPSVNLAQTLGSEAPRWAAGSHRSVMVASPRMGMQINAVAAADEFSHE